jgi:hypothetical protein
MYSRNYARGDSSAKITPPPAYSGSAIQGSEACVQEKEEAHTSAGAFAPFSQNIALPKSDGGEAKQEDCGERTAAACAENTGKERGFLSSLLPDLSAEDLILIGIIIALAFDLADRDILLVALVAAAVIM